MQRESTPPAKRKREDLENEAVTRSEKFWFDDGSVVLQVENTQFRVHRSILASYSTVFDDLFQVPQPESDKSDWVDGCPIVCMSGDATEDWEHVLGFIYNSRSLSLQWPDVRKLGGMMRIGKKYQLDNIFEEALTRFKTQFPQTVAARDFITARSTKFYEWTKDYFKDIADLGEEMALWSILPIAYYTVASNSKNIPEFLLAHQDISLNTLKSLAYGSSVIWLDVVNHSFDSAQPTSTTISGHLCTTGNRCALITASILREVLAKIAIQDMSIALDPWKVCSKYDFCPECRKVAQGNCESARLHVWNSFGKYFLGANWKELEDTKYEVWPAAWQRR